MARKSMTEKDIGKGNMLLTYLFAENAQLKDCYCINCDSEKVMKAELQELAEQWKKRGLIKKYVIADDELIHDKLTSVTDNEFTVALEKTKNIEKLLRCHDDYSIDTVQKNFELVKAIRVILDIEERDVSNKE